MIRPVMLGFVGNIMVTSLISAMQYWKTHQTSIGNRPTGIQLACITFFGLVFGVLIFAIGSLAFLSSMPQLERLPSFAVVYQCAAASEDPKESDDDKGMDIHKAVLIMFAVGWRMLGIRYDFALLQLVQKRDNISIAAQFVPWRSVSEDNYFTMPVMTALTTFVDYLIMAFGMLPIKMAWVVAGFLATCTHLPSLLLFTAIRQRNISLQELEVIDDTVGTSNEPHVQGGQHQQQNATDSNPSVTQANVVMSWSELIVHEVEGQS